MINGKMSNNRKRIKEIILILRKTYPKSHTALNFKNPLQILIATILSAQCTDAKVNQITPSLFKKYKTPADFANADQIELEKEIKSTGFFRNKARSIIGASKKIVSDHKGIVPNDMKDLVTLPGVARKTANIVLSSAFNKVEGIAVDTHVKRLSMRLGLSREKDANKIEKDLMAVVPKSDWLDFNYILVNHGREVCLARKPRCNLCVIKKFCPYFESSVQGT